MIRFEHVSKSFKDVEVLKDISFEIPAGNLVSLLGASGSGKTTTLKMINRLIDPSSGHIYIDGKDISQIDLIKLRRNMGYVIQQTGLFPHMTIRDNIELIPRLEKYNREKMHQKTVELMDMVGLSSEEFLDRYPTELSGGQQQRVGVARAFATDPGIILMDEPFSALDPITRIGLQDKVIDLQSRFRKTIVFVTHDMNEAIRISDRICIMDQGLIVQYDTPEQILRHPINEFVSSFVGKKRIWSSPKYIKIKDFMVKAPVSCSEHASPTQCMEIMHAHKVNSLMVVDDKSGKLKGVLQGVQVHLCGDESLEAGDIMSKEFLFLKPDQSILDVLKLVKEHHPATIPVLDREGVLVGLVTKNNLVSTFSQQYIG